MTVAGAVGDVRPTKPRTWWKAVVVLAVIAGITVWSSIAIGVDVAAIAENAHNAANTLIQLMQPDYSFFPQTVPALLQTVQMAIIATAVSVVIALPVSFWASRATNPNSAALGIVRFIMNVVRSVPDLLYASLFVTVVGTGALSGIFALVLFNLGILVKLVSGAGGLGMLIDQVRTFYQYHYLSLVILEILVIVVLLELLSSFARRRLIK